MKYLSSLKGWIASILAAYTAGILTIFTYDKFIAASSADMIVSSSALDLQFRELRIFENWPSLPQSGTQTTAVLRLNIANPSAHSRFVSVPKILCETANRQSFFFLGNGIIRYTTDGDLLQNEIFNTTYNKMMIGGGQEVYVAFLGGLHQEDGDFAFLANLPEEDLVPEDFKRQILDQLYPSIFSLQCHFKWDPTGQVIQFWPIVSVEGYH